MIWGSAVTVIGLAGTWTLAVIAIQLYYHKYPAPRIPTSLLQKESSSLNKIVSEALAKQRAILLNDRIPPPPPNLSTNLLITTTSPSINRLLSLILRDFVCDWYNNISNDPSFLYVLQARLFQAVKELSRRIQRISLDALLIEKVAPTLISHLIEFRKAEQVVRGHDRELTESLELDLLVASKYGGKLHPALHLNGQTSLSEQAYLRSIADRLLSFILNGAPELQSPISRSLIREILVCVVLKPAIDSLSDPYLWNNLVNHWAGKAVRELHMVFKFRQVLEKQAQAVGQGTQIRSYDGLVRSIKSCKSLIDAKQIRNQIIMEVRRRRLEIVNRQPSDTVNGVKVSSIIRHMNRLLTAKSKVEKRIAGLGGPTFIPRNRTVGLSSQHLSMSQLLASSVGLSFFIEYMDQVKQTNLLQFWLMAQNFRQHLANTTSATADVETMYTTYFAPNCAQLIHLPVNLSLQIAHLANSLPDEQDTVVASPLVDEKAGSSASLLHKSDSFSSSAASIHSASPTKVSKFQPILDAQSYVAQVMETQHFSEFVKSDLYLALINDPAFSAEFIVHESVPSTPATSSPDLHPTSVSEAISGMTSILSGSNEGNLTSSVLDLRQITDEALLPLDTVESVDAELRLILDSEIVPKDTDPQISPPTFHSLKTTDSDVFSLIDASTCSSPIIGPQVSHNRTKSHSSQLSQLSQTSLLSSVSVAPSSSFAEPSLQTNLRQNIDKLLQQEAIVDSLLINAKQAGKDSELISVLTKSKATLHNDMKELLWQEIQEEKRGEANLLTSTWSVSVISYHLEREGSRDHAVFVVEVKPILNGSTTGSGWVVSRRFSEFLTLHSLLKSQFPRVMAAYDLPKKALNAIFSDSMILSLAASRQQKLSKYLQALCKHLEVCESRLFRSFICQEDLDVDTTKLTATPTGSRLNLFRKSGSGVSFLKQWQQKFVHGIESLSPVSPSTSNSPLDESTDGLVSPPGTPFSFTGVLGGSKLSLMGESTGSDRPKKLRSFGMLNPDPQNADTRRHVNEDKASDVFSELFIEIFELKERNNWFRRQAILIILQNLLGDTIDRKVNSSIDYLTTPSMLESYVTTLTDMLWPNGEWGTDVETVSEGDREKVKIAAKQKIMLLVPELMFSFVGRQNATKGALRLFSLTQNRLLNRHILYSLLDHIVEAVIAVPSE